MSSNDPASSNNQRHRPLPAGKLPGPLLDRLIDTYRTRPDPTVLVAAGYGRDAAALDVGASQPLIVKSDPITFATGAAAEYLVAVNGNDVACLGGTPRWLSVVLLLPASGTTEADIESLFADLQRACDRADISIIGGHTEVTSAVSRPVFIGTMIGVTGPFGLIAPGGGRPGDDLYLTKWIGLEGTALLARELGSDIADTVGQEVIDRAAALLELPGISVARDAAAVLSTGAVTALHDPTEGGVATAIHELAAASGCGALVEIDSFPILPETQTLCAHLGIDPLGLISSGALLVAAGQRDRQAILDAAHRADILITRIGRLAIGDYGVTMIASDGSHAPLPRFDADEITKVL
jgi:hydrogenase maturation factor